MPGLLERLGVPYPVCQAGMGGGIAAHPLAAAVSEAGGLGTIGILDPPQLRQELARARQLTGRPVAVNLLLPFARAPHWEVAREADAVITFWGQPARHTAGLWIHQCGSVVEAQAARAAGADAVIAQGVEAGGHVRGTLPGLDLLERVRVALPGFPVLLAGGIAEPGDVARALEAGAEGVVVGTRFLATDEAAAHPLYKERLLGARETLLTELFGLGWPSRHRVIANAATDRWLGDRDPRGPGLARIAHRIAAPVVTRLPLSLGSRATRLQRTEVPLFGPSAPVASSPARLVDAAPMYAGETVARVHAVKPAAVVMGELAG